MPGCRPGRVIAAADSRREKEIVVTAILIHERSFDGVGPRGVIGDIIGRGSHGSCVGVHPGLVDVMPEGAKVHVVGSPVVEEVAINCIVWL